MGGVNKLDQFLSYYYNVLRKTVKYWKTLFYHMVNIASINAFILYNNIASMKGLKTVSETI